MSSIGTTLREARTKKAITLEEVHSRIKIHPRVLQLLEEDKFDKLPSPLFAKSFLKSYAEFLEVNPEEIVQAYEKEGKKEPEQVLYIKPAEQRESFFKFNKNWLVVPVLIAALLITGTLLFHAFRTAGGWIAKQTSRPQKAKAAVSPAAKAKREKPKAAETAPAREEAAEVQWLRSVELGNFPKIGAKTPLELTINAEDAVWLRITCDEKVLFQNILKRGASETWTANKKIEIWTGNSSNMVLSLNKYSLGSPGKGVIKRMVITRDGVKIS